MYCTCMTPNRGTRAQCYPWVPEVSVKTCERERLDWSFKRRAWLYPSSPPAKIWRSRNDGYVGIKQLFHHKGFIRLSKWLKRAAPLWLKASRIRYYGVLPSRRYTNPLHSPTPALDAAAPSACPPATSSILRHWNRSRRFQSHSGTRIVSPRRPPLRLRAPLLVGYL